MHSPIPRIVDENLLTDEKMVEKSWMIGLGKQHEIDWFTSWRCIPRVWCMQTVRLIYNPRHS